MWLAESLAAPEVTSPPATTAERWEPPYRAERWQREKKSKKKRTDSPGAQRCKPSSNPQDRGPVGLDRSTRTFLSRRLVRQVRLLIFIRPDSSGIGICVYLWFLPL